MCLILCTGRPAAFSRSAPSWYSVKKNDALERNTAHRILSPWRSPFQEPHCVSHSRLSFIHAPGRHNLLLLHVYVHYMVRSRCWFFHLMLPAPTAASTDENTVMSFMVIFFVFSLYDRGFGLGLSPCLFLQGNLCFILYLFFNVTFIEPGT